LTGIIVAALLRVPLAAFLNRNYFLAGKGQPPIKDLFLNSFFNIFIWTVCLVAGKLIIDRFRFQHYVDELAKQKETAELKFLNAQFNPHFLFNSINSIYGEIDKHNAVARNMLLSFSDMLRYQLYECNSQHIAVEKELNYIKNYVALQRVRKGENLTINLTICNDVKGFQIAPLLFIVFIENAFKHVSSYEEKENKIDISFQRENGSLVFSSCNTREINNSSVDEYRGIGIDNARQRLLLLYPEKHELKIAHDMDSYSVLLKLQVS
jgi:LytS/YehU family sensor histidine kinase